MTVRALPLVALLSCVPGPRTPPPVVVSDAGGAPLGTSVDAGGAPDAGPQGGVLWIGRTAPLGSDGAGSEGARFAWSGTSLRARFTGGAISALLREGAAGPHRNRYGVIVDGVESTFTASAGDGRYVLASGLGAGVHELTVTKLTEAEVGAGELLALELADGGALLPPPAVRARRLEFIGDSITCGYGVDGASKECPFSSETQNHWHSFGHLTASALGADASYVAFSGRGVVRNYDGSTTGLVPALYRQTLPEPASADWDFGRFPPDAVVINLGTNDFARGPPPEAEFVEAYRALVTFIRARHPLAHVVVTLGPMLTDNYAQGAKAKTLCRTWLSGLVSTLRAAGDTRVHFLEFPEQDEVTDGLGCDYHPSAKKHRAMATQLTDALEAALAW